MEAKQEANIPRKKENELVFDENQLDRLPVILFEGTNPLFTTYFVGKQTLKDIYFGGEVIRV
ncbi:MAG: hypothetical protein PHV07_02340 [Oscillospiraceae bacterium]|nr:hypothetical protein [Oscillospiraceae bacterium]